MQTNKNRETLGFTLLELMISMTILSVISLLSFIIFSSVSASMGLSATKDQVQAAIRSALLDMSSELEQASKKTNTGLTPPLQALTVLSATSVRFQVPADNMGVTFSQPITYTFVNEDANANGRLDAGEDTNGDRALTRCIQRTQNGVSRSMGASNDISGVAYSLNAAKNILTITVNASRALNNRRHDLVTATATSSIYVNN